MDDDLAPRLAVVARNTAEFMRCAARQASLPAMEVMQLTDASIGLQAICAASAALVAIIRRAPNAYLAERLRRLTLAAFVMHSAIEIKLLPQVLMLASRVMIPALI
jgi:hypothetical protein